METGETETPGTEIAVDDTENKDRIEVPDEMIQPMSSKWCFIISLSLVALTIIYFIVGSFLAVGIKTNRYVSLAGTYSYH